jgi:hypothetical protein
MPAWSQLVADSSEWAWMADGLKLREDTLRRLVGELRSRQAVTLDDLAGPDERTRMRWLASSLAAYSRRAKLSVHGGRPGI